jgi:hypothetical protein
MFRILFFFILLLSSNAFALNFDGKFIQGHFIIGKTYPKTKVWIDKRQVKVTKDGTLFLVLIEIENMML